MIYWLMRCGVGRVITSRVYTEYANEKTGGLNVCKVPNIVLGICILHVRTLLGVAFLKQDFYLIFTKSNTSTKYRMKKNPAQQTYETHLSHNRHNEIFV